MSDEPIPIHFFTEATWSEEKDALPASWRTAAALSGFGADHGAFSLVVASSGHLEAVLAGAGSGSAWIGTMRGMAAKLPDGDYRLAGAPPPEEAERAAIEWAGGLYRFDRYKNRPRRGRAPRLLDALSNRATIVATACALARDLINTPANDMGPADLEAATRVTAERFGAEMAVATGDALLDDGYPAVHAVGRAAHPERAPRMIEVCWGKPGHPVVAVVGKGVVFDSGGLDLKPSSGMRWMKKDMGGAAHALALAAMVMELKLPVRLVLLMPVVENAVSADAMRPGDILATRKGVSVEVGNTDAEGRLILADALTRAQELEPDLTIDLATLTGAARVALGPDVVPFYTDDEALAADLLAASESAGDPLWRMPLWSGYRSALDSDVADIKNDPDTWVQGGSVLAALFLKVFAPAGPWVHLDIFAWNPRSRPGWPQGGEAQAIRALLTLLERRYPA